MANFINVVVRERVEGAPGIVEEEEFHININTDKISLFNKGENKKITFVRMACGVTLCVLMSHDKFVKKLQSLGNKFDTPLAASKKKGKKK